MAIRKKKTDVEVSEFNMENLEGGLITPEELLLSLKAHGITSLNDIAVKIAPTLDAKQLRNLFASQKAAEPKPITAEIVQKVILGELPAPPKQPILPLPVKIKGVTYDPRDLSHFDGKPLQFYVDEKTKKEGCIYGFTSKDDLYRQLMAVGMLPKDIVSNTDHQQVLKHWVPGNPSFYYQHINYGGARLQLDPRHSAYDLTEFHMSGYLWWWTSWNDQISSLKTGTYGAWLFEHTKFEGEPFIVGPRTEIPWIGQVWNDRISSIL